MSGCGGSSNSDSNTRKVSNFSKRLFVMNSFYGTILIMNAENDFFWPQPISTITNGTGMVVSPDKSLTLVYSNTGGTLHIISNSAEDSAGTISTSAPTESVAVLSDNKTAVLASRNATVTNQPNGAVLVLNLTDKAVTSTISLPQAKTVALNRAGTKVLAFADDSDSVYVIDVTNKTATPISDPSKLSRPVNAIFSTDDSKAYILNCGAECGGATASVTVMNMSDNSLGATVPVNGATVGLLDGSKLYVAGSPSNVGQLDVVDVGSMTRSQQGVSIANGYHTVMAMADGNKLYIGSRNCTLNGEAGCLSIFNGTTATIPTTRAPGTVTSVLPIIGRNLAYVTIGGELIIFDTTTDAPRTSSQIDIVGFAAYIKQID